MIGKSLEAHQFIQMKLETPLELLIASSPTLIVSELTIAEGSAPEGAVAFEDVAFTVERAAGEVCDRCRRIDPTTAERHYYTQPSVITASIVEENFADAVAWFEAK